MMKIMQEGSGATRPLILVYLFPLARGDFDTTFASSLPPNVAVVGDREDTQDGYASVPTLADTVRQLETELGAHLSPVIVAGHSAGGFAVRRILAAGGDPDAVVLADATYGSALKEWTDYARRAEAGERVFVASHSSNTFMEPARPSPWRNLQAITGLELPLGAGAAPFPAGAAVTKDVARSAKGRAIVFSYPDLDHGGQGSSVLPKVLLPEALAELGEAASPPASNRVLLYGAALVAGFAAGALYFRRRPPARALLPARA